MREYRAGARSRSSRRPLRLARLHIGVERLFLCLELQHHLRDQLDGGLLPEETFQRELAGNLLARQFPE